MKAECKKSFVLYVDYKQHLDIIEDAEEYRALFDAIFHYCATGYEPENLSPIAMMAFSFIKTNIDRDCAKWEQKREKRKKAGSLGGKAKASNAKQKLANASNGSDCQANVAVTATVNGTDNGTGNGTGTNNTLMPLSEANEFKGKCPEDYTSEFEEFWKVYPARDGKKNGKRKAFESWWKAIRDKGQTVDSLISDIKRLAHSYGEKPKDASTWLNGRCWEDEAKTHTGGNNGNWSNFREQHEANNVEITAEDDIASAFAKYGL